MKYTLKMLRIGENLTQADLASALKVSRKTISAWETGKSVPATHMIDVICEFFGVSYDEIRWIP